MQVYTRQPLDKPHWYIVNKHHYHLVPPVILIVTSFSFQFPCNKTHAHMHLWEPHKKGARRFCVRGPGVYARNGAARTKHAFFCQQRLSPPRKLGLENRAMRATSRCSTIYVGARPKGNVYVTLQQGIDRTSTLWLVRTSTS